MVFELLLDADCFCFFLIHCSSCRSVSKSEGGSQTVESISYQRLLRRAVGLVTQGMKCIAPTWSCCCDKHGIYFFCLFAGQETLMCCKWRHSWKKKNIEDVWTCNKMDFKSSSGIQVFGKAANFLLLVSVAVLLPGFPNCCFCCGFGWANRSTPWLIAHNGLNALRERPDVLLRRKRSDLYFVSHYVIRKWRRFCTWWKKLLSTVFSILLIFRLFTAAERSELSNFLRRNILCCGWKSSSWICGGGWQYRSFPCAEPQPEIVTL